MRVVLSFVLGFCDQLAGYNNSGFNGMCTVLCWYHADIFSYYTGLSVLATGCFSINKLRDIINAIESIAFSDILHISISCNTNTIYCNKKEKLGKPSILHAFLVKI